MIKPFSSGQEKEINALICAVFNDFVGYEYTEEGNQIFNEFLTAEKKAPSSVLLTKGGGARKQPWDYMPQRRPP